MTSTKKINTATMTTNGIMFLLCPIGRSSTFSNISPALSNCCFSTAVCVLYCGGVSAGNGGISVGGGGISSGFSHVVSGGALCGAIFHDNSAAQVLQNLEPGLTIALQLGQEY